MKFRIKHKLFLLLLSANTVMASFMFVLNSKSFSDGFQQYIKDTENNKLQPLTDEISTTFQKEGNWLWIKQKPHIWRQLIHKHLNTQNLKSRQNLAHSSDTKDSNKQHPQPPFDEPSRSSSRTNDHNLRPLGLPSPPLQLGKRPRSSDDRPIDLVFLDPHFYIKDKDHNLILGSDHNIHLFRWLPIKAQGEIIGYFGYFNNDRAKNQLDRLFIKEQQKNFLYIALLLVILSTVIALPAASVFVRPIKRVSKTLAKVAQGDYRKKLAINSHDEIADLTKNLNHLAATLEKNLQARQKWLADISHELRTPVTILKGEIEALLDGIRSVNSDTLGSFQYEIERLNGFINDLHNLTITDVAALSYRKQPVEITKLISDRLECYEDQLDQAGIETQFNFPKKPVSMLADEKRLVQLLDNLIQNSIRYTDSPGFISVSLSSTKDRMELVWKDSAPGVNDKELSRLLEPLYRTEHSRNRNTGGSGLGLSICKNIVEAHHGQIQLSHSVLGGISINIEFPPS